MDIRSSDIKCLFGRVRELEKTLDHLPLAVGLFRFTGQAIYLNERFRALYCVSDDWLQEGMTFERLIERGFFETWKRDPATFFSNVKGVLRREAHFEGTVEAGNRIIHVRDVLIEGDLILTMQEDVTAKVLAEREVHHLARHDNLTDLPNRASFNSEVAKRINGPLETRNRFGLLAVDVDRFKDINDVFGHAAGDAVLREIAARFRKCLRPGDFAARLGGDEFMFLSAGQNQPEASVALAERLTEALNQPIEWEGQELRTGISIGVSIHPEDGPDACSLFKSADAALYRAKAEGRGAFRVFEPECDLKVHLQRLLLQDLRHAVENGELELRYQPQATLDREIYGFEALVRWRHATRGLVAPSDFVPLAEESGLIVGIGRWVLRDACREAARWTQPLRISVNLSPVQFRYGGLVNEVRAILAETGLDPRRLELEITEGVLIQDSGRAVAILRELKDLGILIAMDDFGTGYSSLSYLQLFPFDAIKIDKSFIAGLSSDNQAREIVRAVVGLGRGLNIPIIAEGVETEAQMDFLRDAQCGNVQGYLIGKPLMIEEYGSHVTRGTEASAA